MKQTLKEKFDTLKTIERRLEFLVGARLRHRDKILKVVEKLNELQKKITAQVGNFKGVAEIRKWREAGCSW